MSSGVVVAGETMPPHPPHTKFFSSLNKYMTFLIIYDAINKCKYMYLNYLPPSKYSSKIRRWKWELSKSYKNYL